MYYTLSGRQIPRQSAVYDGQKASGSGTSKEKDKNHDEGILADFNMDYDIDLIQEEMDYYTNKYQEDDEESTITPTPRPPTIKLLNGMKCGTTSVVCAQAAARKPLIDIAALRHRGRGYHLILTPHHLIRCILEFIALPDNDSEKDEPLYSVVNDSIALNRQYKLPENDIKAIYGETYLKMIGDIYISCHVKLRELCDFVESLRSQQKAERLPMFWLAFLGFFDSFAYQYSQKLNDIRKDKMLTVVGTEVATSPLRESVDLLWKWLHKFFSHSAYTEWKWYEVELAQHTALLLAINEEGLTEAQISVCASLQEALLPVLFNTMDHLYSFGRIPLEVERHFFFSNDSIPGEPDLLHRRDDMNIRSVSRLWSQDTIEHVLRGARARRRLGTPCVGSPVFTNLFRANLRASKEQRLVLFAQLAYSFNQTVIQLSDGLCDELFTKTREAGLYSLVQDIKSVFVGDIAHFYAELVFGGDVTRVMNAVRAFDTALRLGINDTERRNRWSLNRTEAANLVVCNVNNPLAYLFPASFFAICNRCMSYLLRFIRINEVLVGISSDRRAYYGCEEQSVRRMRFVVHKLLTVISTIQSIFESKYSSMLDKLEESVMQSKTLEDAQKAVQLAEYQLNSLVERDGRRQEIHKMIDILANDADDIRLKSLSNDLSGEHLERWEKNTYRTIENFCLMGKYMAPGTLLHLLSLRLAHRPRGMMLDLDESI